MGDNPEYGLKIAKIRDKLRRTETLTEPELLLWRRHEAGVERVARKRELINQRKADRIAELEVLGMKQQNAISAEVGVVVDGFKRRWPNLMANAYEKVEKLVEQERVARALSLSAKMSHMVDDAVRVFEDHLSGVKEGDLNPVVRQRAAEKVMEIVSPPKAQQKQVVHTFDPKAMALIGQRQAALRAKNDVVTTAEVESADPEAASG